MAPRASNPDRTNDGRKPLLRFLPIAVLLALGAVFGIGAGMWIGRWLKRSGTALHASPFDLLWVPLIWCAVVFIHELGHVLAGRSRGMRFVLMTAGPLKLVREQHGVRLRFNDAMATWGGLALMVPRTMQEYRPTMAWMIAGGPAASLLLALAGFALAPALHGKAVAFVFFLAFMSAAICVATSIPTTIGGFASDGAQLLGLLRKDPSAELRALLATLAGASMTGTRPRDLDAGVLERALVTEATGMPRMGALLLAGLRAADRGEAVRPFFEPMEAIYPEVPDGIRQSVALWLAWHHASERNDAQAAGLWLEKGKGGLAETDQRELALAAVELAAGRREQAAAAARRGLAQRPGMDPGTSLLIRDQLSAIERRAAGP